ncbi:MAG: hypothetical protein SPJ44_09745 [Treponema sp.]|nr:hypothetical protein [Treponema sp.]
MAKCDNCYHYEACLNSLSENKGLNNTEVFACEHYKDKSLIAELPCRVGDVVYVLYTCDLPHEIEEATINSINIRKESTQIVFSNNSAFTVWENDWSVYKKYVFSSSEEAERALEESEKQ